MSASIGRTQTTLAAVIALLVTVGEAQSTKQLIYTVGPRANVLITNHYGSITVNSAATSRVIVKTISHSDAVSFENEQHGNRVTLRAHSSREGTGLADYMVSVPSDAFVTLRSSDGILRAHGLRGDVTLESATAPIEATDIDKAYVSVKTLGGSVLLADIRNSHLNVRSIGGTVSLRNVTGSSVEVHSGTGRISYEGDPGRMGEYLLTSHTGDLEISIPANTFVGIKARSEKGGSDPNLVDDLASPSSTNGNLLLRRGARSASRFVLRSFKGNIHVKRTP